MRVVYGYGHRKVLIQPLYLFKPMGKRLYKYEKLRFDPDGATKTRSNPLNLR